MSNTPLGVSEDNANALVNAPSKDVNKVGVFISAQSLITFPGATAAVTTIWKVLGKLDGRLEKSVYVPVIAAIVIGLLIYLLSVSKGTSWRQKIVDLGIALINSATVAAAALGIS